MLNKFGVLRQPATVGRATAMHPGLIASLHLSVLQSKVYITLCHVGYTSC